MYACMPHVWLPNEARKDVDCHGTGVTWSYGSYEWSNVDC